MRIYRRSDNAPHMLVTDENPASVSFNGDYPTCNKLPADEKKSNVSLMIRENHLLSLNLKLNIRNQPEGLSTPKTMGNNLNLIQTETTTPELGQFVDNAIETSTPCNRRQYLALKRPRPNPKK
uniref:Uncharacterized protein n=1 Tax=Glossina pallidipes TaxID=7398 RepID=A0A1A9ZGC4_GLOPL